MKSSNIEANNSSINAGQQLRKSNMTAPIHWYSRNERRTSNLLAGSLFVKSKKNQSKGFKFYTFIRETLQYYGLDVLYACISHYFLSWSYNRDVIRLKFTASSVLTFAVRQ